MSKSNLEWNKISAAVLVAGIVTMIVGLIADALYVPVKQPEVRGYQVLAATSASGGAAAQAKETAPVDIAALMKLASVDSGKKIAKKCTSCHSFTKDGKHKTGPNLWNIVDAPIAGKEGYNYSKAFKAANGKWDNEALYAFITKPKAYIKGTKMGFAGIRKPEQTADLIAYLKSLK